MSSRDRLAAPTAELDLRLVPAAGAVWAVSALALRLPADVSLWAAAGFAGLAAVAVAARGWLSRRPNGAPVGPRAGSPRTAGRGPLLVVVAAVLGAVLALAAASALGVGLRVAARDASPVAVAASRSATATLELTITDDPRPIAGGFAGRPRVLVAARASVLALGGMRTAVDADVIVLADAASWSALLPSQRVVAGGRLLPAQGGDLVAAALAARGPPELVGAPSALQRAAGTLRAGLVEAARVLSPGPRGLLPGLVLGDTSGMDPTLTDQFRTTGLSHLVAVSGANCAIVVGAVIWLLRWIGVPRVVLAVVAGLALAGFVVLVRPSPSVLRAAAMGAIALLALASGRPRTAVPALAATVIGLVLLYPELAWSAGFALSVAATAGIVLAAPRLTTALRRRRVPPGVAEALAVSVTASLATAPLIAALSGAVSLVSVPANLLAAPAVPAATVLGVLATLVSPVSPAAATALAWLAGLPTTWLVVLAEHGSALPDASLPWRDGAGGGLLLGSLLIPVVAAGLRWRSVRRVLLAVVCSTVVVVVPVRVLAPGWPPAGWLLVACDVGQGDALVVRTGGSDAVVVDAGPDPSAVDRCLRELGVRRIPLLVLSHLHADHSAGLPGVLAGRDVALIEIGPQPEITAAFAAVTASARQAGAPVVVGAVGEVRSVGGVRVTVLAPDRATRGTRSDPNDSSLVVRVETAGVRILLTGDIEVEGQQRLLRSDRDLTADVLKVAHHGSAYQDEAFLAAVDATVAVVSVGTDNSYGHPSPALMADLQRLGMRVARTDLDGAIAVGRGDDGSLWLAFSARGPPGRPQS